MDIGLRLGKINSSCMHKRWNRWKLASAPLEPYLAQVVLATLWNEWGWSKAADQLIMALEGGTIVVLERQQYERQNGEQQCCRRDWADRSEWKLQETKSVKCARNPATSWAPTCLHASTRAGSTAAACLSDLPGPPYTSGTGGRANQWHIQCRNSASSTMMSIHQSNNMAWPGTEML